MSNVPIHSFCKTNNLPKSTVVQFLRRNNFSTAEGLTPEMLELVTKTYIKPINSVDIKQELAVIKGLATVLLEKIEHLESINGST